MTFLTRPFKDIQKNIERLKNGVGLSNHTFVYESKLDTKKVFSTVGYKIGNQRTKIKKEVVNTKTKIYQKKRKFKKALEYDSNDLNDNVYTDLISNDVSDHDLITMADCYDKETSEENLFEHCINLKIEKGNVIQVKFHGKKRVCFFFAQILKELDDQNY